MVCSGCFQEKIVYVIYVRCAYSLELGVHLFFCFFNLTLIFFFFFFFQAEVGIRDLYVTVVQTCALPILSLHPSTPHLGGRGSHRGGTKTLGCVSRGQWTVTTHSYLGLRLTGAVCIPSVYPIALRPSADWRLCRRARASTFAAFSAIHSLAASSVT